MKASTSECVKEQVLGSQMMVGAKIGLTELKLY